MTTPVNEEGYGELLLKIPIIIMDDLKEQLLGDWEQKPWQDVPEFFSGDKDPPHGESRLQLDERLQRALQEVSRQQGPVLIVSHGSIWFALHRLLGLEPDIPGSCVPFHFQSLESDGTKAWTRSRI